MAQGLTREDYLAQDACGLAALIAAGEVSAAEVLETAIALADALEPQINAIVRRLDEAARERASQGAGEGRFAGVPFLIKDLTAQMAGVPTSGGSKVFATHEAAADSALVEDYRRAGLIIFGKTSTPEFGLEPVTEPQLFGPTRNPWDLSRTAGGSSGGAAAAVAAGIVPAAHASDGGGSIRIPASCCGLFGLKPTRGRVSFAPAAEGWGGFSTAHALTRSVRDSAALLDAVCQPRPGDPYAAAPPPRPFELEAREDPGRLRIGFSTGAIAAEGIDPVCAEAVRQAADLCESLGHEVEEVVLDWDYAPVREAGSTVIAANVAAMLEAEGRRRGRPVTREEVEPATFVMFERGKSLSATAYLQALQIAHAFGRRVAAHFERIDLLMTSTLGLPPPPIGWLSGGDPRGYVDRLFALMPNTQAFNMSGHPAMSVPLCATPEGLPIGIQFVAPTGAEALLFALAGQLERAQPWRGRSPLAEA